MLKSQKLATKNNSWYTWLVLSNCLREPFLCYALSIEESSTNIAFCDEVPSGRMSSVLTNQQRYQPGKRVGIPLVDMFLGIIFIVLGGIFGLVGLFSGLSSLLFFPGTVSASGTIVHCNEVTDGQGDISCQPTIRFQTQAGQTITFVSSVDSDYKEGDTVTIAYHPAHPQDARISGFLVTWALPVVFGALGLIGLVSGLVFLLRNRRKVTPIDLRGS